MAALILTGPKLNGQIADVIKSNLGLTLILENKNYHFFFVKCHMDEAAGTASSN